MCPRIDGEEVPTGCVATATAIIMKYHEYPKQAIGGVSSYYNIPIEYSGYDWNNMLMHYGYYGVQSPTEIQNNAVAKLMWHCGANMEMEYKAGGSSASTYLAAQRLVNVFGYANTICAIQKYQLTWYRWKQIIKTELQANRPVLYSGSNSRIGHAVVCDGYTKDDAFHINWGWGGSYNGYFQLSTMDCYGTGDGYAINPHIIIGIQPPTGNDVQASRIISSDLECGDFPLRAGVPFKVRVDLINLITGEGESFNDYNGYIGLAVAGTDGTIQSVIGDYKFDIWHPQVTGVINKALGSEEKIIIVSRDKPTDNWHIVNPLLGTPPGLTMNGLLAAEEDILEEPAPYVRIDDSNGSFDREQISIGTLHSDIRSYSIYNNTGKLFFKYQLKDPQSWLPSITMSYGKEYNSTFQSYEFTTSGEAWISSEEFNIADDAINYSLWQKILSNKEGSLVYEISVYDEMKEQCYDTFEYSIDFVAHFPALEYPEAIKGNTNEDIYFKIYLKDPGSFINRPVILTFNIPNTTQDETDLAYMENEKSQPCKFTGRYYGMNGTDNNVMFEKELIFEPYTVYVFKLTTSKINHTDMYITLREKRNNKNVSQSGNITLNIKETATGNMEVEGGLSAIKQIASETRIEVIDQIIKIRPPQPVNISIVSIDGKYVYQGYVEDTKSIQTPRNGIYIFSFTSDGLQTSRKVYVK